MTRGIKFVILTTLLCCISGLCREGSVLMVYIWLLQSWWARIYTTSTASYLQEENT